MTDSPDLERLLDIMARLRDPVSGCPWDLAQNFKTIAPYTIEEAYEVAEAIEAEDASALKDELGDLLLQVVFHARIAEEDGRFAFNDVAEAIANKMVRRHPHVFAETEIETVAAQLLAWEEQKAVERRAKGSAGALDGVGPGLPALTRSAKLQRRAARVGFDWPNVRRIFDKMAEETEELHAAMNEGPGRIEEEIGDLLFTVVNIARYLDIDPEQALRGTCRKFERRFRRVETLLAEDGKVPGRASLEEMEANWERAKAEERGAGGEG